MTHYMDANMINKERNQRIELLKEDRSAAYKYMIKNNIVLMINHDVMGKNVAYGQEPVPNSPASPGDHCVPILLTILLIMM